VGETLKLLRATLPATIAIRHEIDDAVGPVKADPTQLHQVLMNLCTNAHYAMRDTGGVLEVRLKEEAGETGSSGELSRPEAGRYAVLQVKDSGPGIEERLQSRIFEPYFTTKGSGEGSGLGLAVVHGIVTNCGGNITVESEPGEGTTMSVRLPVIMAAQETSAGESDDLPRGTERILFIDDEHEILRIGSRILSSLGYKVTSIDNSAQALQEFLADPQRYDLILTDQTLPGMVGSEIVKRALEVRPGMPVVMCTGYSHSLDEEKAREIGARSLLLKPFTMPGLAEAVRRALDHQGP
jgi:CheY-like chemotaxis protein